MTHNTITVDVRMLDASGIGTYLRNLLPLLFKQRPANTFRLMGDSRSIGEYSWSKGTNVEVVDWRAPVYSISEQLQVARKFGKDSDLYWSPHYDIPLFYGGKLVATVHDLFHLAMAELVRGTHKRAYARTMFAALIRKSSRILCVSHFTKEELIRLTRCDSSKIRVVHNGIAPEWFDARGAKEPADERYLLFVGNVKPHKNLSRLLDAFEMIQGSIPHRLIIVGKREGFLTGDAAAIDKASQMGSRVRFTGQVTDTELIRYYQQADALVFPSLYEGFGFPPLEAMASGCPCLVSNIPALREVCANGALYCDPNDPAAIADKIVEIIQNKELRMKLKDAGRARAELFTWEETAKGTLAAFEEALTE